MYLKSINLLNFKNYEQAELEFSSKINCFVGNNGVGKTNLLDAIHYLSMSKSYFNTVDSQNIQHEKDFFVIQGYFEKDGEEEEIYCGIKRNKRKQFKRNKKEYQKLSEHIGLLPIVMISPADSSLILEGSEERRKFLNAVISQYDKKYLNNTINYNHALTQRNVLLKNFNRSGKFDAASLEIWDDQLIPLGERIYKCRKDFSEKLVPIFQKYYDFISKGNEKVALAYESQLQQDSFRNLLSASVQKDRILEYTTTGIHKDDLILKLGDNPIKKIGSQGQQKTFLVALKLAKFDFIKKVNGFNPILLLDDIFDKFDNERVTQIVQLVADDNFGQIFITDTDQERWDNILRQLKIEHNIFKIPLE
ncbi:MAG: DNA replication/repair protein RecF [Bacteroidales bacterium]|nr:DNA replication/repair protein RecF [Bacteroidales bacterium]